MLKNNYYWTTLKGPTKSRTMKGRVEQKQQLNAPTQNLNSAIDSGLKATQKFFEPFSNWLSTGDTVGGERMSDPNTYWRGNNEKLIAGILGGPLGSLALKAFDNLKQTQYDATRFTGGGQSGARVGGKSYFDLITDILRRQGVIK